VPDDLRSRDASVEAFYDSYGAAREWERFETPLGRVQLAVITEFLRRWALPAGRTLDVGSGPGRFALWLARQGARVTLLDISSAMLDAARRRFADHGLAADGFLHESLFDLAGMEPGSFDLVLCLGGALNYYPDEMEAGLRLMRRLLRPGGRLVGSVMSTVGGLGMALGMGWQPEPGISGPQLLEVYRSGLLTEQFSEHRAKMLHAQELRALLGRCHLRPLELSATDCMLALPQAQLTSLMARPDIFSALLEAEFDACRRSPDAGGHILFAAAPG
jgi:SAM-dependent methyltransferase